jgi:hypothetical protein
MDEPTIRDHLIVEREKLAIWEGLDRKEGEYKAEVVYDSIIIACTESWGVHISRYVASQTPTRAEMNDSKQRLRGKKEVFFLEMFPFIKGGAGGAADWERVDHSRSSSPNQSYACNYSFLPSKAQPSYIAQIAQLSS